MKRQRPRQAQLDPSGRTPAHQLGMVEISGTPYRLIPLGAWGSSVSYVLGNTVTSGGTTYLCIAANTNEAPPNATYWQTFDDTTYFLRADRVWAQAVVSGGPGLLNTLLSKTPSGFWKLNETSGTVAHDSSGNAYDLPTDGSTPTWGDTAGPPGEVCALFSNSTVEGFKLSTFPDLTGGGSKDFTVLGWFKFAANGGENYLIGAGVVEGNPASGWGLYVVGDGGGGEARKLSASFGHSAAPQSILSDNALTIGDWYMGALVQSGGVQTLYVNGLLQAASGGFAYDVLTGIQIGNTYHSPVDTISQMNGDLSYWAIIPRALSGSEVLAVYNSAFPNQPDGSLYSSDGAGGTTWRQLVVTAPLTVTVTADEIELGDTGSVIATADPASPAAGYTYFNPSTGKLNIWDGSHWWRGTLSEGATTFPSIRSSSFLGDAAATTGHVISAPAGVVNGDVLVMFGIFPANPGNPTITLPAGWTSLWSTGVTGGSGDLFRTVCAWKLASSEPSSYTITSSLSDRAAIKILAVKDSTGGTVGQDANNTNGTAGTSFATPSITTTTDGDLIIALMGTYNGSTVTFTHDPSFTEYSSDENSGNHARVEVETYNQPVAGTIGATATASLAAPISAGIISIRH